MTPTDLRYTGIEENAKSGGMPAVAPATARHLRPPVRLAFSGVTITLLIFLVLVGTRPYASPSTHAQTNTTAINVLDNVIVVAVMVATVVGAAILAFIFWPTRRRRRGKDEEEFEEYTEPVRIHWAVKFALTALPFLLIAGVVSLVYTTQIDTSSPATQVRDGGPVAPIAPPRSSEPVPTGPAVATRGSHWVAIGAAAMLGVAALALAGWTLRRGSTIAWEKPRTLESATSDLTQDLAAALDESLEDLRRERDPRRAVIKAYVRMERILARHGFPRREVETPEEYAARVLRELGLGAREIRRLTRLFELARFSQHDIIPSMQEQAIAAVTAIRQEL